jgi:tRNA threonylcarbamoyladenosine biosynthesis protein TsaE
MIELSIETPEAMGELGARIARLLRAGDVVALNGELGAGKTTFTRGLGEALGVRGPVTSPTFVLARTHPSLGDGPPLVHVDAYRLSHPAELDDLDIDFEASVVVVEWAAGMLDAVVDEWLDIRIQRPVGAIEASGPAPGSAVGGEEGVEPRRVTILGHGPRWSRLDTGSITLD